MARISAAVRSMPEVKSELQVRLATDEARRLEDDGVALVAVVALTDEQGDDDAGEDGKRRDQPVEFGGDVHRGQASGARRRRVYRRRSVYMKYPNVRDSVSGS